MLAQALVEHGMLSAMAATIERTAATVENLVRGVDPRVAVGVLVVFVVVTFFRGR